MRNDLHPDYLAADPSHRLRGSLKEIWERINVEASRDWPQWRGGVLPGGAFVALRIREPEAPRELIIYRKEPHKTEHGPTLWTAEVLTFAKQFGVLGWKKFGRDDVLEPFVKFTEVVHTLDFFGE